MDDHSKDFKAVKVQLKASQNQGEVLSRGMLYSGINIFGQLSQMYLQSKETGSFPQTMSAGKDTSSTSSVMSLNQEVLSIFKRMQKKDSNTKVKALQELERYVDSLDLTTALNSSMHSEDLSSSLGQSDELSSLLTFFLYHFCRLLVNEPDKKVRESAHLALAAFLKRAKRRLGPHLKRIFSLWYCSFFDPSPEVAAIARRNFESAFPEARRDQVFKLAYKNFLHFANEQLRQSEEQLQEQVAELSQKQREDVFDRVTSSVLLGLAHSFEFTSHWPEEERAQYRRKLVEILDLGAAIPYSAEEAKGKKH